jgi:putative Mn2+ efflux pump MntP
MNWPLIRTCLLITALATAFNLGRMSVDFSGAGSDWTMLILGIVTLICSLIGLAAGELVRDRPRAN